MVWQHKKDPRTRLSSPELSELCSKLSFVNILVLSQSSPTMVHPCWTSSSWKIILRSSFQTRWWTQGQILFSYNHDWQGTRSTYRWSFPLRQTSLPTPYLRWYGKYWLEHHHTTTTLILNNYYLGPWLARRSWYLAQWSQKLPRLDQRRRSSPCYLNGKGW